MAGERIRVRGVSRSWGTALCVTVRFVLASCTRGSVHPGACVGGKVTTVQSLDSGLHAVHCCWAACGAPHHVGLPIV